MAESAAQAKARLRREKRAGVAAERLTAITKLQGGTHRDVEQDVPKATPSASPQPQPQPQARLTPPASGTETPDPDEIDISQHSYAGQRRLPSYETSSPFGPSPFGPGQQPDGSAQDPMMAMLQQMMGAGAGTGGMPGQANNGPSQPDLANLLSAMQGGSAQDPSPDQSSAWLWRLIHSLFSLGLAIFIVFRTPFTGSKLARGPHGVTQGGDDWMLNAPPTNTFAHFFYMFATFEVVMQTSRYFIEKGQLQGGGWLNTIGQILPEPYAGYVRVLGRYSVIYSAVVSDSMVVVFVLGAASWWNGGAIA